MWNYPGWVLSSGKCLVELERCIPKPAQNPLYLLYGKGSTEPDCYIRLISRFCWISSPVAQKYPWGCLVLNPCFYYRNQKFLVLCTNVFLAISSSYVSSQHEILSTCFKNGHEQTSEKVSQTNNQKDNYSAKLTKTALRL